MRSVDEGTRVTSKDEKLKSVSSRSCSEEMSEGFVERVQMKWQKEEVGWMGEMKGIMKDG